MDNIYFYNKEIWNRIKTKIKTVDRWMTDRVVADFNQQATDDNYIVFDHVDEDGDICHKYFSFDSISLIPELINFCIKYKLFKEE